MSSIIIVSIIMVYLILVLQIYTASLYHEEFDNARHYSFLAPMAFIKIMIFAVRRKEYRALMYCLIFQITYTYTLIGTQYCLIQKKYAVEKTKYKIRIPKLNISKNNMSELLNNTKKYTCKYS